MQIRRVTESNTLVPNTLRALLLYPRIWCFPVRLGANRRQRVPVVPKGTPDILGVISREKTGLPFGQAFAVEMKKTHGIHCKCDKCETQRVWRAEWEKRRGLYVLATTTEQVLEVILPLIGLPGLAAGGVG